MQRVAEFEAIGTRWRIDLPKALDTAIVSSVLREVHERIEQFDRVYSRFRQDSLVTTIAQASGTYTFPIDAIPLFSWYRTLYEATDGLVTPLIGSALSQAGYDATYSLLEREMTSPKAWDDVMTWKPSTCELIVREPVLLDFGAAGKGYCVDLVADVLRRRGVRTFVIDAGGDILCEREDGATLRVGLEDPADEARVLGVVHIRNASICGSAGNRRTWGRFHHTLNPKTLESPRELAAVWVVASSTMVADGLTTALQFVTPDRLAHLCDFSWAVLSASRQIMLTENFPGEVYTRST